MARQSWGQYNHRHSKDHIHIHQTGATMYIRIHVATGTLIKQYSVEWSALCLWKAWQLWRRDNHRHNIDHIHIHQTGATMFIRVHVATGTLIKQYSVEWSAWSALCLWKAWKLWRQDNHSHNKDHIHIHQTGATMFIRVHVATETLIKQYSAEWSALCLWKAWQLWRQDIHRSHSYAWNSSYNVHQSTWVE